MVDNTNEMTPRVLVLGSGFAGQGHTRALRAAGCQVVGMAARSAEVVTRVARDLEIPWHGTDWRAGLAELRPQIVAVGTPGGAHVEPILAAVEAGCHIFCDKPLAADAASARRLAAAAAAASKGVKTAFAASYCYQPQALLAERLVADGAIGDLQEVECVSHYGWNPLTPFGWSHRVSDGGGRLHNNFTHKLAIVLRVSAGKVTAVTGECRNDLERAPGGAHAHDFREREQGAPTPEEARRRDDWHSVDSDWSYTVLVHLDSPRGRRPVSGLFRHMGLQPRRHQDYICFFGSSGALHLDEAYAQGACWLRQTGSDWRGVEVPPDITSDLPDIQDDTQRNWTQLAREFVADVRGTGPSSYLTFAEGAHFQEVIDTVRRGAGWTAMPGPAWTTARQP